MKYNFTRCTAAMPATRFESQADAGLAALSLATVTAKAGDPRKTAAPAPPANSAKTAAGGILMCHH